MSWSPPVPSELFASLPRGWSGHVKSDLHHAISLAAMALTVARSRIATRRCELHVQLGRINSVSDKGVEFGGPIHHRWIGSFRRQTRALNSMDQYRYDGTRATTKMRTWMESSGGTGSPRHGRRGQMVSIIATARGRSRFFATPVARQARLRVGEETS